MEHFERVGDSRRMLGRVSSSERKIAPSVIEQIPSTEEYKSEITTDHVHVPPRHQDRARRRTVGDPSSSGDESHTKEQVPCVEEISTITLRDSGLPVDGSTLKMLAKLVAKELRGTKALPIYVEEFTGAKSPYLAEEALMWLRKLKMAARQNDWSDSQTLDVAAIHLKGLAARWFFSVEKYLIEALRDDSNSWWSIFETMFKERFADFVPSVSTSAASYQFQRLIGLRLKDGEDVREYAENFLSINNRFEQPLGDQSLNEYFVAGLPSSKVWRQLYTFTSEAPSFAGLVKEARRLQLMEFQLKSSKQ